MCDVKYMNDDLFRITLPREAYGMILTDRLSPGSAARHFTMR